MRLRVLFVGESWLGSCARTLREALARRPDVVVDELAEESFYPNMPQRWLRAAARLLRPMHRRAVHAKVLGRVKAFRPDVFVTYKGATLDRELIEQVRARGVLTANVYPDASPHAHGEAHREAVGAYDVVISTKIYQPRVWKSVYGDTTGSSTRCSCGS
jgi:hypothetical protein